MSRPRLAIAAVALGLAFAPMLRADVVTLADGRTFTGEIIERTDDSLTIKTLVGASPVTLRLPFGEADRIQERKLPADFFTPKPEPVAAPEGTAPEGADRTYLEIPIRGKFGEDVVAEGVHRALQNAVTNHVPHIIFTIDSAGGSAVEAMAIQSHLERYEALLQYHAVIERAEGVAMAVPIWCDTIHIRSTGTMGGVSIGDEVRRLDDEGRAITDDAIVARAAAIAQKRGLPGIVIAAMVIPEETIEAWRDESGEVRIASALPEDSTVERSIFKDGAESRLTLTGVQAEEIGIAKTFDEELDELGNVLAAKGWTAASQRGVQVMRDEAAKAKAAREKGVRSVDRFHDDIAENVKEHDETLNYVVASLAEFRQYDPRADEFETIRVNSGGIDWSGYYHYYPKDTHQFTDDSKKRWKLQTDLALRSLARVRKGLKEIEKLDEAGEKLGIVRDSAAELGESISLPDVNRTLDIDTLRMTVETEMERLARERNREGN